MAILTDANKHFHPKEYRYQYQGTKLSYQFATFKILVKNENELDIAQNPFSVVMLTARKALIKSNLSDSKQLVWKMDLVRNLQKANYEEKKIRKILNSIRYYVRLSEEKTLQKLEKEIQTTLKRRKNMGIEEAILQEVEERGEQKGVLQAKIKGIKKALLRGKLTIKEIAEDFEVSTDFVQEIQKGEMQ